MHELSTNYVFLRAHNVAISNIRTSEAAIEMLL